MPLEAETLKLEFVIDDASLPPDTFMVVDFVGEEHISQPFRFEVNVVSYEPDLTLTDVSSKPATLEVYRGDEQLIFHGQVARFEQGPYVADRYGYTAVLVPSLWYLSLQFQSRIFRDMSTPEIIEQVLQDAGFQSSQYKLDVNGGDYPTREYCAQYQETDLDFIQRLAEHEGIRYYFEGEKVIFIDKPSGDDAIPKVADGTAMVYNPGGGLGAAAEAVRKFNCREQLVRGKHIVKDYNYRDPETVLEKEMQLNDDMPGVHYEYGLHFKNIGEADRLVKVRNEETECQRRVMWGETGYVGLHAGYKMEMEKHYRGELNGEYLLVSVRHTGTQAASVPGLMGASAQDQNVYTNTFSCIPTDVLYRPPRVTPVPRISGIMTGRIEKHGGDYADIDEEGRYRARMHFDRGSASQAEATHLIRMKQPYSGPNYGVHFPNHADTEMVWACIDGNPDRPMALGTGPNPTQKSPSTSTNKWQSVIRSWGQNELTFDDKVGEENIYMHATKDHTVVVIHNESISVGNDQTIAVGHDRDKTVGNDQSETVGVNKTIAVGANHTESIGSNMVITVGQNLTETVTLNYAETVGIAMQLTVGASLTETIGAHASETVGVNKSVSVGASLSETVGNDQSVTVGKNLSEKVGGDHHEQVAKEFAVNAKKIQLIAEDQIVLKTGSAEIIMKKNGDIEIQGKKIQIKGSGDVIIKGKQIKEN